MADGRTSNRTVQAEIRYFKSSVGKPTFGSQNNAETEQRLMTVHDASSWAEPAMLDREGIALFPFKTRIKDFTDRGEVKRNYGVELAELICAATGAKRGFGYGVGHVRYSPRCSQAAPSFSRPAPLAHVDVTPITAPGIGFNPFYSSEPEVLKPGERIIGYNVWRVLSEPPHDIPLAVCDQRTVARDDLVEADGVYDMGGKELVRSEAYLVRHNPAHRWIYFSGMTPGDALIFRAYETNQAGHSPVPHAAFTDPSCPQSATGRISVEARVYAVFDA